MTIQFTCPLIDDIICHIENLEIDDAIEKLEDLRKMNAALRYDAYYWKKMYNIVMYGDKEFNPEVLPKIRGVR